MPEDNYESITKLDGEYRGTGRTTKQMQSAPKGAAFVWVNAYLAYPKHLASLLKRQDLLIVSPSWLEYPGGYLGKRLPGIVLDHAADLTSEQWRGWEEAKARIGMYTILGCKNFKEKNTCQ